MCSAFANRGIVTGRSDIKRPKLGRNKYFELILVLDKHLLGK